MSISEYRKTSQKGGTEKREFERNVSKISQQFEEGYIDITYYPKGSLSAKKERVPFSTANSIDIHNSAMPLVDEVHTGHGGLLIRFLHKHYPTVEVDPSRKTVYVK